MCLPAAPGGAASPAQVTRLTTGCDADLLERLGLRQSAYLPAADTIPAWTATFWTMPPAADRVPRPQRLEPLLDPSPQSRRTPRGLHPYSTRHTGISRAIGKGIDLQKVRRRAGHGSLSVTSRYAAILNEEDATPRRRPSTPSTADQQTEKKPFRPTPTTNRAPSPSHT